MRNMPEVRVCPSNESFLTWIDRPYISAETRAHLSNASALIVPREGYGERSEIVYFPNGTDNLLFFLKNAETDEFRVGICIEDRDYKELALYADVISVAMMLVTTVVAPLVVNLIADWVDPVSYTHLRAHET